MPVDSRFRVATGGENSDSEFTTELPHPINVKGRCFVDTVLLPNSFDVIRPDNDKIYVRETELGIETYRTISIIHGQYNAITLRDALLAALELAQRPVHCYLQHT